MALRNLAVTGYPGWLTNALFDDMARTPVDGLEEVTVLALPSAIDRAKTPPPSFTGAFNAVPFDLAEPKVPPGLLNDVDVLLHAAGTIHVKKTRDWYAINTAGTLSLARQARAAGVRRFIFVSSIAAAGKSQRGRDLIEEDEPKPMHHYGRSKLLAERALLQLHEPDRFEIVILRPAMFYGPPVPERHIDIYRRVRDGRMPLVGKGAYNRSLVHIDNLVQAVRLAFTAPGAGGQTYFVVDRAKYTTRAVVDTIAQALGTDARYIHIPPFFAELAYQLDRVFSAVGLYIAPIHLLGEAHWHQAASCNKAMRELGYVPHVDLADGMHHAVDWSRKNSSL